jgi:hypothetical protein
MIAAFFQSSEMHAEQLHSRKLRGFAEVAFQPLIFITITKARIQTSTTVTNPKTT